MTSSKQKNGFTILEMSIVLIIISLIIGGIFAGASLIRESKIRAMLGEYDRFLKAIQEFQDKYGALPGDMLDAETYWGSDSLCPATVYNEVPKIATCNGDGGGTIGTSTTAAVFSNQHEWFRAWQHLSNAGLIDGKFTGAKGSAAEASEIGINVPTSKFSGGGWSILYYLRVVSTANMWGGYGDWGHLLLFGGEQASSYTNAAIITASEMLSIDQKIDDAKPGRGIVRAFRTGVQANCTENDTTQDSATYKTSNSQNNCSIIFVPGF